MVVVAEASGELALVHQLLCGREIAKDVRENVIHRFAGQMANYVYVLVDNGAKTAAVVDPAWDTEGIFKFCEENGLELKMALFTHRHFDHTGGKVPRSMTGAAQDIELPGLVDFVRNNIAVYVGKRDAAAVAKQCGIPESTIHAVEDGEVITLSERVHIKAWATPGHTPGSVCFQFTENSNGGGVLFTGDTLFIGSCGRIDLPESNVGEMLMSLTRLSTLPEDTLVLPGHNYAMPAHSTIGAEKSTNGMMVQAINRYQRSKSGQKGVDMEPVAAFLPLPNYLGVVRKVFDNALQQGQDDAEGGSHQCGCLVEHSAASQLESHF